MNKTKAQLEEEITYLTTRVAALEGACAAYRFALEQSNGNVPQPIQPYMYNPYHFDTWPGLGTTPQPFPYVTYNNNNS